MLATLVREPFDKLGWVYEEKYDGYRILAYKEGAAVTLMSRNALDRTAKFAAVAQGVAALSFRTLLLDGEVVVFDSRGVSRFQLLQNLKARPGYAVFDCLYLDGRNLRADPLSVRRTALEQVLAKPAASGMIFASAILSGTGPEAFAEAERKGFEGVVAKDDSAPYIEGRSRKWLKFKVHQEDEFLIVGYTAPTGTRKHFGALLLGAHHRRRLCYVGKVGTGFTRESLDLLSKAFRPLAVRHPTLADPPEERSVTWLAPRLVAQIAYEELTADHKLRQPVFLGLRTDKRPQDVILPEPK